MIKSLVFVALIVIFILRILIFSLRKKDFKHMWVSFYLICVPLQFEVALSAYKIRDIQGVWGKVFTITVPILLIIIFSPRFNIKKIASMFKSNKWVSCAIVLLLISLINPYNSDTKATLNFILFFLSQIILFLLIASFLSKNDILKGMYEAFFFLCIAQFILAICFPVLKLTFVTEMFHGKTAGEWATRMNTRVGAVGLFTHPGNLALFTIIGSAFFLSTYLNNVSKKLSLLILICNLFTLVLTYSRTSYLAFILVISIVYFIYKLKQQNIFSLANTLKFIVPTSIILYWLVFLSPFSADFLKSDSADMYQARAIHWFMALTIFKASPIIGVGLNTHLTFLSQHTNILKMLPGMEEFFVTNPIHNIHLIILSETGIVGFILWILFLFTTINNAKQKLARDENSVLSLTLIGVMFAFIIYGMTGWAPLSKGLLPFFLFLVFFFNTFNLIKTK